MDPYHEQRLRDEVMYLHSLWHQGPPTNSNPKPNTPSHNPSSSRHLKPANPTQFKKQTTKTKPKPKPKEKPNKRAKKKAAESDPPPLSVTKSSPTTTTTETPLGLFQPAVTQEQQKALNATQEFFSGKVGKRRSIFQDDDDSDDGDGDGSGEEYGFFLKLFMEDGELRGYYEKNCKGGDFVCLVCGGVGKNLGKRFNHSVPLVQHSVAMANSNKNKREHKKGFGRFIAKTKKKWAHKAFALVICKVLGWDVGCLPSIQVVETQGNSELGLGDSSVIAKDSKLENGNAELGVGDSSVINKDSKLEIGNTEDGGVGDSSMIDKDSNLENGNAEHGVGDSSMIDKDSNLENGNAEHGVGDSSMIDKDSNLENGNAELGVGDSSMINKDSNLEDGNAEQGVGDSSMIDKDSNLENGNAELGVGDSSMINKDSNLEDGNAELGVGELSMLDKDSGLENVDNDDIILKEVSDAGQDKELHNSNVPGLSNVSSDGVMLYKEHREDEGVGSEMDNSQLGIIVVNDLQEMPAGN